MISLLKSLTPHHSLGVHIALERREEGRYGLAANFAQVRMKQLLVACP